MLAREEQCNMGLARELGLTLIPLAHTDEIVELIARYNSARKLPHLTIIDNHGDTVQENALHLLLEA